MGKQILQTSRSNKFCCNARTVPKTGVLNREQPTVWWNAYLLGQTETLEWREYFLFAGLFKRLNVCISSRTVNCWSQTNYRFEIQIFGLFRRAFLASKNVTPRSPNFPPLWRRSSTRDWRRRRRRIRLRRWWGSWNPPSNIHLGWLPIANGRSRC